MSHAVTIYNLPVNTPDHILEEVLAENCIEYSELAYQAIEDEPSFKAAHLLLDDRTPLKLTLDVLNETELADLVLTAEETSLEITNELIRIRNDKQRKILRKRGIIPEEDRVTPNSLEDPSLLAMPFYDLEISDIQLANLDRLGIQTTTPIQALSIPFVLEGRDIIGRASTGTGKTLAYAIPIVEKILAKPRGGIRALILSPTRELAIQIQQVFEGLLEGTPFRAIVIYGGEHIIDQIVKLREGIDILIATPGRLLDLQGRGRLRFDMADIFVLDEADRMMDMGFMPDVNTIHACFFAHPQTLMFSATTPKEFLRETVRFLNDPVFVDVGAPDLSPLDTVTQEIIHVKQNEKDDKLYEILSHEEGSAIVFTSTKKDAERLASRMAYDGFPVARIHGDIDQEDRLKAVTAFREGKIRFLIATDVAARGLDIDNIAHIINYDLPNEPEDHLHRIGRTARAGATGKATTFVTREDRKLLKEFEIVFGKKFE